jgi:hypothetical protein
MCAPLLASPPRACSFVGSVTARKPGEPAQSDAAMKLDFGKIDVGRHASFGCNDITVVTHANSEPIRAFVAFEDDALREAWIATFARLQTSCASRTAQPTLALRRLLTAPETSAVCAH